MAQGFSLVLVKHTYSPSITQAHKNLLTQKRQDDETQLCGCEYLRVIMCQPFVFFVLVCFVFFLVCFVFVCSEEKE